MTVKHQARPEMFSKRAPPLAARIAILGVQSAYSGYSLLGEERLITTVDLKAEFARLTMLKGRTPTSSEAERKGAFATVAPYRDGAIFTAKFAGTSAWERHPQGDEIVQIVDGATTLHLMTAEGRQH
jgi:hypothetical protein